MQIIFALIILLASFTFLAYPLFHLMAELLSIAGAFVVFISVWQMRAVLRDGFINMVGASYLFVAAWDFLHVGVLERMLSPGGMGLSAWFWMLGRLFEVSAYATGLILLTRRVHLKWAMSVYAVFFIAGILLTFSSGRDVVLSAAGGMDSLRIHTEYTLLGITLLVLMLLFAVRDHFYHRFFLFLNISMGMTVVSEYLFSHFYSEYGLGNYAGHLLKLLSFAYMAQAVFSMRAEMHRGGE